MADEVQIDSLSIAIEQSANDSSDSLARLSKNLGELKSVTSGLRLTNTVNRLRGIADATSKLDRDKVAALGELGGALEKISGAGKISSSFAKQITGIGAAIDGLGDIDTAKLTGLADALSPLAALDRAKLTSYINQLKQLPEVADALDGMDMDRFAASIRRTADAMKPLADEMEKVSNGFSALPTKIQRIIRENERMTASTKRGATGWKVFWKEVWGGSRGRHSNIVGELLGIASATTLFFKTRDVLVGANTNINDYIENLNLYGVAMGKYAKEQFAYAKTVEAVLGINPSRWTRMQAVIQDMAKSFGVAEGTATLMSKSLTQLTFDYASFYNLSTDEAANKVRSAIAGEIEPVRALGKDLSVAKLQLTATELGINGTVEAMTQADKAMLRTITLLRQSESVQGDLARTLDDPANQMRIFAAQTEMLSTALGELFLPILQEVLPYAIATVKVLRMVTEEFARLAGFEMPDFESTSATEEVESLGGALEDAADAAKELYQLSFDELNILGAQVGGGLAGTDTDKLTSELERLAAIQDAAFMKDVEDSVAGITEDMVDWLTKGEGIEKWTRGVYDNVIGVKDAFEDIVKKIGLWDEEGGTKEKLQKVADIIKGIATSVLVIKGIGLVNSIIKAVTGDGALATILGKIFGNTEKVADAFDKKNKKLETQTEDTVADTAAVTDLAGELAGATKKTDDASDALNIMGGVALWLAGLLTDNPLTPVVDSSDATAALDKLVEQTGVSMGQVVAIVDDQGKTVAEKEAAASDLFVQAGKDGWDELVRLASEYGVTIVEKTTETGDAIVEQAQVSGAEYGAAIETAFTNAETEVRDSLERTEAGVVGALDSIDQEAVDFSNSVTGTVSTLGENVYNGLTEPVEEAAQEIGGTVQAIADEYKELQDYLRTDATSPFKSKLTSHSVSGFWAKSGTYIESTYAPDVSERKDSWKNSFLENKAMQDAAIKAAEQLAKLEEREKTRQEFFKYAQTIDKNPELTSKLTTGANVIKTIIDNTLDALKWLFGGVGMMSFGIPAFAGGGIVEDGLFMANSTELVGRFANGRTAVANNQQITDGIANGVREANHELIGVIYATAQQIVQAVNEGSVLYLDGERVTKKVTNAQNRANRMHGTTMQNV